MVSAKEVLMTSVKENAVILMIDVVIAFSVWVVLGWNPADALGLVLLVEGAGLMLAGGSADLGTSASARRLLSMLDKKPHEQTREKREIMARHASVFGLTGVLLFIESFLLGLILTGS